MKMFINQVILISHQVKWSAKCVRFEKYVVIGISERPTTYQNVNNENMWKFSLINNNPHSEKPHIFNDHQIGLK